MYTTIRKLAYMTRTVRNSRGWGHFIRFLLMSMIEKAPGGVFKMSNRKKELLYWEKQLSGMGSFSGSMAARIDLSRQKELFPMEIMGYVGKIKADSPGKKKAMVLDVGSGPISLLSWGCNQGLFDLITVDPLADDYNELIRAYGHGAALGTAKSVQAASEEMGGFLEPESFDIVYCNNALDHTTSPRQGLEEMVKAVRPGGYIIISGSAHEGSKEGWDEIHQHDLYIENDTLWCKGRRSDGKQLASGLPLVAVSSMAPKEFFGRMMVVFKKNGLKRCAE